MNDRAVAFGNNSETQAVSLQNLKRYVFEIAIVFLAYVVAGKLGQATINIRSSNLGPVWPAYGVAVAAILICGYRVWFGVAVGAFLVAFSSPVPAIAAVGQAAGATLAAMTAAFLLHHAADFRPSLPRLSDALSLIVLGAAASSIVSASIGVSVLYATHVHAYSGLGAAWLIYWLGDATGVLLVTALTLTFADLLKLRGRHRISELAVLLLLLTVTCLIIFIEPPFFIVHLHFMAFAALPFVIWAAVKFGMSGTTLSLFIVATIATVATSYGTGPFAHDTPFRNAVLLDVFFAVISISGMMLAAVIGEREHLLKQQSEMEMRLRNEQVVRESEERLRLAFQAGKMYAYEWDVATDKIVRSEAATNILNSMGQSTSPTRQQLIARVHPDDRAKFIATVDEVTPKNPNTHITYRVLRADGGVIWLEKHARAFFGADGKMLRIIGMVADVTERKLSEERLREYEKAVEGAEDMIGVIDREYRFLLANHQYLKMRNLTREQVVGHLIPEVLNKEIFETVIKPKLDECFQGKVVTYEMKFSYPTVGERDLLISYFPIEGVSGVDRAACILRDITDRKRAEEALTGMSRKLIEAQEHERSRIGRELHDDVNQKLAMLALELEQLEVNPSELQTRLQELRKQLTDLSNDVQALSHDLHSSKLEYLGVVSGIKSWCKEFRERQKLDIDFKSDVSSVLPFDVGICLFRVLQESLHNAVKHSGVKRIDVQLREVSDEIHLIVSDLGRGFDVETAIQGRGLGLTSMQERVRLLNGTIAIESKPMAGTTIHVRVPLELGRGAKRAAS